MTKPNILMIYQTDPLVSSAQGGGVRHTQNLMWRIIEQGFQVIFLGATIGKKRDVVSPKNLEVIPVVSQDKKWLPFLFAIFFRLLFLRLDSNTVVHIQRTYFALPFLLIKKNIPLVCTIHGIAFTQLEINNPFVWKILSPVLNFIESRCVKRIDYMIALD